MCTLQPGSADLDPTSAWLANAVAIERDQANSTVCAIQVLCQGSVVQSGQARV
jgi:hypothetical protein